MKKTLVYGVALTIGASIITASPAVAQEAPTNIPQFIVVDQITSSSANKIGMNISGEFTQIGRVIQDMGIDKKGNLIAGYGDWGYNVDSYGNIPVSIEEIDPTTGKVVNSVPAGTEAMDVIKHIDGDIYIPMTDPSNRIGKRPTGTWTNSSGDWKILGTEESMIHVLDVDRHGDKVYQVGSVYRNRTGAGAIFEGPADGSSPAKLIKEFKQADWSRVYNVVADSTGKGLYIYGDELDDSGYNGLYYHDLTTSETKPLNNSNYSYNLIKFDGQAYVQNNNPQSSLTNLETGEVINILPPSSNDDTNSNNSVDIQVTSSGDLMVAVSEFIDDGYGDKTVIYLLKKGSHDLVPVGSTRGLKYEIEVSTDGKTIYIGNQQGVIDVLKNPSEVKTRFTDIDGNSPYYYAIRAMDSNKALWPFNTSKFHPNRSLSIGQVLAMTYEISDDKTYKDQNLKDVSRKSLYYKSSSWAVTNGYTPVIAGRINSSKSITELEFVQILYKIYGKNSAPGDGVPLPSNVLTTEGRMSMPLPSNLFTVGERKAVEWAVMNGILPYYNPGDTIDRKKLIQRGDAVKAIYYSGILKQPMFY